MDRNSPQLLVAPLNASQKFQDYLSKSIWPRVRAEIVDSRTSFGAASRRRRQQSLAGNQDPPPLPLPLSVSYWQGGEKERESDCSAGKWSLAGGGGNGERLKIRNMLVTSLLLLFFLLPPRRLRTQFHRGKVPFLKLQKMHRIGKKLQPRYDFILFFSV